MKTMKFERRLSRRESKKAAIRAAMADLDLQRPWGALLPSEWSPERRRVEARMAHLGQRLEAL